MQKIKPILRNETFRNWLVFIGIITVSTLLSLLLSHINEDNNPFAISLYILSVALIARYTSGYLFGILASVVGTFCVNYIFTYPYWQFNITLTGYPLTFAMMLVVSVIISTLTTRIKAQEQIRFEAEREKMRTNLLRAMAHDIRTPLASIIGASSALCDNDMNLSEENRKELESGINRDAQWLVRVTENLLSVTRFSDESVQLKTTDEVLEEIVGSAIVKYHRTEGSLPVKVDHPADIILVPMDAMLIEQVLVNLFDNVSAHGESATQIWLSVAADPGQVTLCVEDDGVGIPDEAIPHIFNGTFHKQPSERPDTRRNMGIGLSVCQTIIWAHGGEMSAGHSKHGGALFSFTLPCEEETHGKLDT